MRAGDRVNFQGRAGTVLRFMPAGMVDIQFDDVKHIERRALTRLVLAGTARANPRKEPRLRERRWARQNVEEDLEPEDQGASGLSYEEERQRTMKERAAQQIRIRAEQEKFYAKPITAKLPGKVAQRPVDAGYVEQQLRDRAAVMFSDIDPPRITPDRGAYCGNPIDGVAYYLVVADQKQSVGRWVKRSDVERAAQAEGATDLRDFFLSTYLAKIEEQPGLRVYPQALAARKTSRSRSKIGLREDLAIRERKAEFSGAEASSEDFSLADPSTGKQVFYRVETSESPGQRRLRRFQAYGYKRFIAAAAPNLVESLHLASRRDPVFGPLGISRETAQALIVSGAVWVEHQLVMDPAFQGFQDPLGGGPKLKGLRISISLREKEKSPFFSWVRSVTPLRERGILAKCLSGDDRKVREELAKLRKLLGMLDGALGRVRSLFGRLAAAPGSLKPADVQDTIARLATAYARVLRWWGQIVDRVSNGDPVAEKAWVVFTQTALNPVDPRSLFSRALLSLQKSGELMGFVGYHGWTTTQADEKTWQRRMRGMERQGFEVEVIDASSGKFRFRVPFTQAKSELINEETGKFSPELYSQFMPTLLNAALQLPRPGRSALLFFMGKRMLSHPEMAQVLSGWAAGKPQSQASLPHPMDDLWLLVRPSLHAESAQKLEELRKRAEGDGIEALRDARPTQRSPSFELRVQQDPAFRSAVEFGDQVGQYAVEQDKTFDLQLPSGWPVSAEQQIDANWAIQRIVNEVYPTLTWEMSGVPFDSAGMCRDLLLLVFLYDMLQGHTLSGPLNPLVSTERALLKVARRQVEQQEAELQEAELLGGRGLSEPGKFTTYVTYNPVLYEMTRLFWPSKSKGGADPTFGSFLAHWPELKALDDVGVYGHAVQITQEEAARSKSEKEVGDRIRQSLSESVGVLPAALMKDRAGQFRTLLLSWPLGESARGVMKIAEQWFRSPVEYLRGTKQRMEVALRGVLHLRKTGYPQAPQWPPTEMPKLYPDRPITVPESSVSSGLTDKLMVSELDRAIARLDRIIEQQTGTGGAE